MIEVTVLRNMSNDELLESETEWKKSSTQTSPESLKSVMRAQRLLKFRSYYLDLV